MAHVADPPSPLSATLRPPPATCRVKSAVSVPGPVRWSVVRSTNSGIVKKKNVVVKKAALPKANYKGKSKVASVRVGRSGVSMTL